MVKRDNGVGSPSGLSGSVSPPPSTEVSEQELGELMKVRELVDELMQGNPEHVIFIRASDGSLGLLETAETEVDVEEVDGRWEERTDEDPALERDGMPVRQATIFVLDGPVS